MSHQILLKVFVDFPNFSVHKIITLIAQLNLYTNFLIPGFYLFIFLLHPKTKIFTNFSKSGREHRIIMIFCIFPSSSLRVFFCFQFFTSFFAVALKTLHLFSWPHNQNSTAKKISFYGCFRLNLPQIGIVLFPATMFAKEKL